MRELSSSLCAVLAFVIFLSFGLRVGMPLGIILGFMFYGGVEVLKHLMLRWVMYQQGISPWRYTRFLEYAKKLHFLKPQSSGYAFIHDWFQEYFFLGSI